MKKKVVIYVRVSKTRSDQTSLATQEAECKRWAEAHGYEVAFVFVENGRSAYKKNVKRPMFDKAMAVIERKQAHIFLVWKVDRFFRSGSEFNSAWQRIDKVGAEFASVMEPYIDTTNAIGRYQLAGIAYQAEIESENRAQRTNSWNRGNMALEGGAYVPGGPVRPYGYDRPSKGVLTINESERDIIELAAELIMQGASLKKTVRDLAPVSTKVNDDGSPIPMTARGLRHVLTNETTYGLRRSPTGSLVKGCWDAILPPETFGPMCAIFEDPTRRTASTNEVVHLLSGLMVCGKCEAKVGIRKWKQNPNGRKLQGAEAHRYTCECGNSIDEANANAVVMNRLWETVTPEVWQTWKIEGHGFDPTVTDDINARIEKLDMMFLEGKIAPDRYEAMNATLRDQLQLSQSDEPLDLPDVEDIEGSWEELTVEDQRKVVRQAFNVIKLNPANGTRNPIKRMDIK